MKIEGIPIWDASLAYNMWDYVRVDETGYVALQSVPVGTPVTNTDFWEQIYPFGQGGSTDWDQITNKPDVFPPDLSEMGAYITSVTQSRTHIFKLYNNGYKEYLYNLSPNSGSINTAFGSIYRSGVAVIAAQNIYPVPFTQPPHYSLTWAGTVGVWASCNNSTDYTRIPSIYLYSPVTVNALGYIALEVKGF